MNYTSLLQNMKRDILYEINLGGTVTSGLNKLYVFLTFLTFTILYGPNENKIWVNFSDPRLDWILVHLLG